MDIGQGLHRRWSLALAMSLSVITQQVDRFTQQAGNVVESEDA
jgi:hypothetical protein